MILTSFPSQNLVTSEALAVGAKASLPNFVVQSQGTYKYWCWAAVASSVSLFYNPENGFTMCQVATALYHPPDGSGPCDCCDQGNHDSCDVEGALDTALETTGNYNNTQGPGNAGQVTSQIEQGSPVGLRVQWPSGEGHFIGVNAVATGSDGQSYLSTTDPIYGSGSYSVSQMLNSGYTDNQGTWTDTYYTKKAT